MTFGRSFTYKGHQVHYDKLGHDHWIDLLFLSETIEPNEYNSLKNDLNIIIGTLIKVIKKTKDGQNA